MNGLEAAIKNALARADRTNAEIRARIYQSARQALETGLRKQNINDPDFLTDQRHRLEVLIHAIEQQERAAIAATEAAAVIEVGADFSEPAPSVVPESRAAPAVAADMPAALRRPEPDDMASLDGLRAERHRQEPLVSAERRQPEPPRTPERQAPVRHRPEPVESGTADDLDDFGTMRVERDDRFDAPAGKARQPHPASAQPSFPDADEVEGPRLDVRPEVTIRHRKPRRGFFSRLFIFATLLAAFAMGGWWVYSSGLLLSASERDTSVPNPPPSVEPEDFVGNAPQAAALDPQQGFSDDWIVVFDPAKVAELRPHRGATVEVVNAGDGNAVRLTSKSAGDDGNVEIPVPVSTMREMVGKTSTIALTMQSPSDKPIQVSVECNFNLLGTCPRHRVTVNPEKSDVLLQVAFDRSMAPAKPGTLIVNGDITGKGQPVRLYSVRVLPGK